MSIARAVTIAVVAGSGIGLSVAYLIERVIASRLTFMPAHPGGER